MKNTQSDGGFDGIVVFRTLGYIVGLPCFIVGTALFMLGLSMAQAELVVSASLLYSVALVAIGGRVVLLRWPPRTERQAFLIAVGSVLVAALVCLLINSVLWALSLPGGFSG